MFFWTHTHQKGHTPRTSAPRWSTRLKSLCRAPRRPNNVRVFLLNTSRNTFHRYIAPNPFRSPPRSRHIYFSPPHDRLADRIRGKVTALKDRTYSDKSKGKGFGDIAEGETYEVVEWKKCESSQHNCSVHVIRKIPAVASAAPDAGKAFRVLDKHVTPFDDEASDSDDEASDSQHFE
jgi:hypothetical protein